MRIEYHPAIERELLTFVFLAIEEQTERILCLTIT